MENMLEVKNLSISFGGLRAVSEFDMNIGKGQLYGLIGPNGAGKTTIFNLLTGVYKPDEGIVKLDGQDITGKKTIDINKAGIARTFQNIRLFSQMSVLDNVKVGLHNHHHYNTLEGILRLPRYRKVEKEMNERAMELLKVFDLEKDAEYLASNLPYGQQRKLEIARALATDPKLLLLDEPAAGMNPNETKELMETISFVRDHFNMTILLIEHDMKLVSGICEELTVLNFGKVLAQERSWYDFMLDCMTAGGVMKRLDLAINDKAGILDIPKLKEKYKAGECISYFRMQKDYSGTEKCGSDLPKNTGETLYLGSTSSELYMCAYQKNYEQYVKNGTEIEDTEIKNRFEIRMKNERAYYAVVDLLTYRDAERTAFSIINHYVRFVDREDDKPKSQWITNDDWAWFVGENREPIRLTTKPEPYTLQKALHWLQRQVAPTIKMVQALDRENRTTILKDMIEQAELKDKHKHLLQLEKSTIEERIDTAVPQENDGIF